MKTLITIQLLYLLFNNQGALLLPLILYFMGDKTTAALIGAGSSALGGAVGLLTNSAHRQYKYQKKLMQLQNSMNQENATIAYNRSRQLTQD